MNTIGELVVTKAITVRLPWAAAIRSMQPGAKRVENRSRPIPAEYIGTRVGVHAAAAWSKDGAEDARIRRLYWGPTWNHRPPLDAADFPTLFRRLIAVARVAGCHQVSWPGRDPRAHCCRPWGEQYYVTAGGTNPGKPAWHIEFDDVVPLAEPVGPVKGSLAVPWTLPEGIAAQVTVGYLDAP